jgi:hypothetical protein
MWVNTRKSAKRNKSSNAGYSKILAIDDPKQEKKQYRKSFTDTTFYFKGEKVRLRYLSQMAGHIAAFLQWAPVQSI